MQTTAAHRVVRQRSVPVVFLAYAVTGSPPSVAGGVRVTSARPSGRAATARFCGRPDVLPTCSGWLAAGAGDAPRRLVAVAVRV